MDVAALSCALLALAVYWNTLDAGFVYDDRRAILSNPDVVGNATPSLRRLVTSDFWGTPLSHSGSHGSWRPLVTLSFRGNHVLGWRAGWHAGNAAAHALCAALVCRVARRLGASAAVAGAVFALHPVHCEAVAGLVGRADLLAAACSLLALLCYATHVDLRDALTADRCRCRRCGAPLHRHTEPSAWRQKIRRFLASLCHPHRGTTSGGAKPNHHTDRHPTLLHSKRSYSSPLSSDYNATDAPITEEENNNTLDSLEPAAHQNFNTYFSQVNDYNHKDIDSETYREAPHRLYNVTNGYATSCTVDNNTRDIQEANTDQHFDNHTSQDNDHRQKEIDTSTYRDTAQRPRHFTTGNTTRCTLNDNIPDSLQQEASRPFNTYTPHGNDHNHKKIDSSTYQNSLHQPNHVTNGHITSSALHTTSNHVISSRWYLEYYIRRLFQWSCRSSAVSETCELSGRSTMDPASARKIAMSDVCSLNGLSSAFLTDKFVCKNGSALSVSRRVHKFNNNNNTFMNSKKFKHNAPENERTETLIKRSSRRAKKRKRYRVDHIAEPFTQSAGCLGCGRGPSTSPSSLPPLAACVALSACALLCKETGVAALAVCASYDAALLLARGLTRPSLLLSHRCGRRALCSLAAVCVCLVALVLARLAVSSGSRVGFSRADNPVAGEPRLSSRALTLLHAPAFCWLRLLLLPTRLCFCWGMSALPLLHSPLEARAVAAAACYLALAAALRAALNAPKHKVVSDGSPPPRHSRGPPAPVPACRRTRATRPTLTATVTSRVSTIASITTSSNSSTSACGHDMPLCTCSRCGVPGRAALLVSLSLLALPYVPASNALFYVGFVAAERVLYLPSAGHCLLLALGWARLRAATSAGGRRLHALLLVALAVTLASLGARTVVRNRDWRDEESLFRSALHINPPKAYGNLGSVLSSAGRLQEAEWALRQALRHRPNMADVHYNLGNLLVRLGRAEEAERSYRMAIQCRPSLAVAYVSLGRLLEVLGRRAEAAQLYGQCARLSSDGLRDPAAHDAAAAAAGRRLAQLLQAPPGRDTAADDRELYRRAAAVPHGPAQQAADPQLEGASRR